MDDTEQISKEPTVAVLEPCIRPNPRIVAVENKMAQLPQADCPVTHEFTNGMYIRTVLMKAGTLVASKVHKTQHPYVIRKGRVSVFIEEIGEENLEAGHMGVTQPGTHRLLLIHEDTLWTTFHPNPTNERDLEKLEAMIIEPHDICLGSQPQLQ